MLPSDRRTFLGHLSSLAGWMTLGRRSGQQPVVDARPTALFQQPEGRKNLVRITVSGLSAPAARARVTDRRGALVGTAGLLPSAQGVALTGEVWVPLSEPSDFQIDVEVGRDRAARRRLRLTPGKRWTLYWLPSIHTDVGYTDLQERALLQVGVADVGVDRREPVEGPTFPWREAQPAPRRAIASDLDVDLEIGWLRERDPDFTAQRDALRRRQQPRRPDEGAAPA